MNLLTIKRPLVINPQLAVVVGLNEAIVLQQLSYWLGNEGSGVYENDKKWVYNTYKDWQEQMPFFSERTIQRAILSLEEKGIILSAMFNRGRGDRTKFYSIDYDHHLLSCANPNDKAALPSCQIGTTPHDAKLALPSCQIGTLSTETTTETTTDNKILVTDAPIAPTLLTTQPSKPKKSTITAKDLCIEFGVDEQIAQDWLVVRKAKKSPLTITALKTVIREAQKAGITLSAAIECSAESGWVGFKAEWYENRVLSSLQNAKNSPTRANNGYATSQASVDRLNDTSWAN